MRYAELGRVVRLIRQRDRLTQSELGRRAGLSRGPVQRLESGAAAELTGRTLTAIVEALGAQLELVVRRRGAELDRIIDEGHARLVSEVVQRLKRLGWQVEVEVSFSEYGERGSIDILGWHATTATLLVVEVKTELGSVEGLLRPLDVKVRLAPLIARDRFGWRATRTARLVVFADGSTVRRQVERHGHVFESTLPQRSRRVVAWLREPRGTLRGLWFLSAAQGTCVRRNSSTQRRVRKPATGGAEREPSSPRRENRRSAEVRPA